MNLWIRSQDKSKLIKASKINTLYDDVYVNDFKVGSYDSHKRAIEIIDNIELALVLREKIYQMPES